MILPSITNIQTKIQKKSKIKDANHPASLLLLYTDVLTGMYSYFLICIYKLEINVFITINTITINFQSFHEMT